jgi:GH24 family phage-related lysozyme (muramidase)
MAAKKKKAGAAAAAAGAGGPNPAAARAAGAPATPARPCGTCDPTLPYSIQFRVKDGNGKLIDGMYYTVKYKNSGDVYTDKTQGSTAVNTERSIENLGLTLRYYTSDADEKIFLYIGHRTAADGYPEDQSAAQDAVDEAPLKDSGVAPVAEKKIVDAPTTRKWKPWKASNTFKASLEGSEQPQPYEYKSPEGGNNTIGKGHKITDAEKASGRFKPGGQHPQPLDTTAMDNLQDEDIEKNGGHTINETVFVPLHDYEVDAILDLTFNGGPNALTSAASSIFTKDGAKNPAGTNRVKLSDLLNRGRYSLVPDYMRSHYNTVKGGTEWMGGVENRRDMDARMFAGEAGGYTMQYNYHGTKK